MTPSIAARIRQEADTIHNKPWEHVDNRAVAERLRMLASEVERLAGEMRHWNAFLKEMEPLRDPWHTSIARIDEVAAALDDPKREV